MYVLGGNPKKGGGGGSVTKSGGKSTSMMAAWVASGHLAGGVHTHFHLPTYASTDLTSFDVVNVVQKKYRVQYANITSKIILVKHECVLFAVKCGTSIHVQTSTLYIQFPNKHKYKKKKITNKCRHDMT